MNISCSDSPRRRYDPHFTPNLSDAHSRYSYGNQTSAMHWDLMCLGRVLSQLISVEALQKELDAFQAVFTQHWEEIYAKKFGFNKWSGGLSVCAVVLSCFQALMINHRRTKKLTEIPLW